MSASESPSKNSSPYRGLPRRAYWRAAVSGKQLDEIGPLWVPKFSISRTDRVVTFGSCFAQHIGRALANRKYNWLDTEPPPPGLPAKDALACNYGVFSSRTANIYTTTLLLQWVRWALGHEVAPDEIWEGDGRYYDPFRPNIEPNGFESPEELLEMRAVTIDAFAEAIRTADCFVFTLGLTESWWNKQGYEYPTCPGTVAGIFDPEQHEFRNLMFAEVIGALTSAIELMQQANPAIKFVLTVSPVPLTASYSGNHVLVATMESKSVLRAVAGQLARQRENVAYFPSYEIINSPVTRGQFFDANLHAVMPEGVAFVMGHFFRAFEGGGKTEPAADAAPPVPTAPAAPAETDARGVVCEEELLDAFRPA